MRRPQMMMIMGGKKLAASPLFVREELPIKLPFNPNNHEINYEGDAYPAAGAIQLTLNERDKDMSGKTGRATYLRIIAPLGQCLRNLADFTTHFSFVISMTNISSPITGDGLAFFLAPGSHIPPDRRWWSWPWSRLASNNGQLTQQSSIYCG
ncbi:hypothetical protein LOK49_LG12G00923 [Camellia lanceoleosa]|uniref:Uncharacterized protein n=1 Tax=Camellia lanceoleosa TaxID=1840588 RepID=A0ACC0FT58_9ERIC|nr:hypothetical protein LOK49_LG12G00923 [Camellia lanceoleosa]